VEEVWTAQGVDGRETTLIWDVDGDGDTEVLYDDYRNPGKIYQINGSTWVTEEVYESWVNLAQNNSSNAMADVDGDGTAEYFFVDASRFLHRIDYVSSNPVWSKREETWVSTDLVATRLYTPSLIDFDGDGNVELYMGNQIYDMNGNLIDSDPSFTMWDLWWSVAADILPVGHVFVDGPLAGQVCTTCDWLELAVAWRLYTVDISAGANALTYVNDDATNNFFLQRTYRWATSIADMDNDGDLDIVYTSPVPFRTSWLPHVIVRDGQTEQILMLHQLNTNIDPDNWVFRNVWHLEWRANIADFDGDGCNEMWIVTYQRYTVVDDVFSDDAGCTPTSTDTDNVNDWWNDLRYVTNTDTSWMTSSSVFDFDGDGKAEVVYRDEDYLLILEWDGGSINGSFGDLYDSARNLQNIPGLVKLAEFCGSWTRYENPVVVDVNDDGATEIVVACTTNARAPAWYVPGVKSFTSTSSQRAPSRSVWNQHGYHVTNVRNDLTIPAVPVNNASSSVYDNYLTQSEPLDYNFTPLWGWAIPGWALAAADAELTISTVDTSDCANSLGVSTFIENFGDANLTSVVPVTFYDSDPTNDSTASIVDTQSLWIVIWTWQAASVDFTLPSCTSPLYAVVNDPGTVPPEYSLVWTGAGTIYAQTSVGECDYENNLDAIKFSYCGDGIIDAGEECDDGNAIPNDGCSIYCETEYCRDDAPLNDTTKNFVVTDLSQSLIAGTSLQANSQVAICMEDTTWTRDVYYTTTDATGSFSYAPTVAPYAPDRVNVGIMLHDENDLDIDHHALQILN